MPLTFRCLSILIPLSLGVAVHADPASQIFTGAQLPETVQVAKDKDLFVKVWSSPDTKYALSQDGTRVEIRYESGTEAARPRWNTIGKVSSPTGSIRFEANAERATRHPSPALLLITEDEKFEPKAEMDILRGRLDTAAPTADLRRMKIRTNAEGAGFRAPENVQAWKDRAEAVRTQLLVTQGLWPLFPKTDLNPKIGGMLDRDGYTIEKVVLETMPGFTLSGNLYRPKGKEGRLPGLLCPHGHWADGRVNETVQQRCIAWAKLGAVVFMYDMVGYADSKEFKHVFLNDRLNRWGLSLVTLQTFNSIRALDWLSSLTDVDPARIGCTGESGGGTQTFLLTAIDQRIKVAAPVVMVSDSFQGGCVCENCAGLRLGTDNVEFAALCAPRPMKLVGATGDWTAMTMTNAYPALMGVYSLYGAPDRLSADVYDFEHNYNQTTRNSVYAFMGKWLLGINDPEKTREGAQTIEKPEDLFTFNKENLAPSDLKTVDQLERTLIDLMQRQVEKLAPTSVTANWEASRDLLLKGLTVRLGHKNPSPGELVGQKVRRVRRHGLLIIHETVGRKHQGDQIPVVRLIPEKATGRSTIIVSERGKAALLGPDGTPSGFVQALLDRGQEVIGFDPFLAGEAFDPVTGAKSRPQTVHFDTYNPSLAADRIQDLATVLAWAGSQPEVREVSLFASGSIAPLVLLARPTLPGLARTVIDLDGFDYGDGSGAIPKGIDLPGCLQFGGLKVATALTAPQSLWLGGHPGSFDRAWPIKSYQLADGSQLLKLQPNSIDLADAASWIDTGEVK